MLVTNSNNIYKNIVNNLHNEYMFYVKYRTDQFNQDKTRYSYLGLLKRLNKAVYKKVGITARPVIMYIDKLTNISDLLDYLHRRSIEDIGDLNPDSHEAELTPYNNLVIFNTRGSEQEKLDNCKKTLEDKGFTEQRLPSLSQYPSMFVRLYWSPDKTQLIVFSSRVNQEFVDHITLYYTKCLLESFTDITEHEENHNKFVNIFNKAWEKGTLDTSELLDVLIPDYAEKLNKEIEEKRKVAIEITIKNLHKFGAIDFEGEKYDLNSKISAYEQTLTSLYQQLNDLIIKETGVKYLHQDESESFKDTIDLLKKQNTLFDISSISQKSICIGVRTTLKFWDSKEYDNCRNAYFANYKDYEKYYMDKIWKTKEIKIHMVEFVYCNLNNCTINFRQADDVNYTYEDYADMSLLTSGIPNPHHAFYNCWGDNKTPILKYLANNDLYEAVQQIISAVSTINVVDNAVFAKFCNCLVGTLNRNHEFDRHLKVSNNAVKPLEYKGNRYTLEEMKQVMYDEYKAQQNAMSAETNKETESESNSIL